MAKPIPSTLYVVATPIGNPKDITLRAVEILSLVDAVICEEYRLGSTLLKKIGIQNQELLTLNEHNEHNLAQELVQRLVNGESFALVSDGGTPVFADPGSHLIKLASQNGVRTIPVPGPSSLMAALSMLDFNLKDFVFAGFLSPKKEIRKKELEQYKSYNLPVIIMDTPYRLGRTLEEVEHIFGMDQRVTLTCDLTLKTEQIYRGSVGKIRASLNRQKAEFILIIH
jgi:16S rRNA (cytidine1402-2'-O)-methyltransferase